MKHSMIVFSVVTAAALYYVYHELNKLKKKNKQLDLVINDIENLKRAMALITEVKEPVTTPGIIFEKLNDSDPEPVQTDNKYELIPKESDTQQELEYPESNDSSEQEAVWDVNNGLNILNKNTTSETEHNEENDENDENGSTKSMYSEMSVKELKAELKKKKLPIKGKKEELINRLITDLN